MRPVARPIPVEAGADVATSWAPSVRKGPAIKSTFCSGGPCPMKVQCPRFVPHFTRVVPTKPGQPRPAQPFPSTLKGTLDGTGIVVSCQWTPLRAFALGAVSLGQALDKPENLVYIDPTPET